LGTDYDWRKCEAKLNALPNFMIRVVSPETRVEVA
jgi:epoxide hydrolase-like protein